jgi:hypothetical protein
MTVIPLVVLSRILSVEAPVFPLKTQASMVTGATDVVETVMQDEVFDQN